MKFLFFFVHPSKYHLYRNTINYLKENYHQVDILITKKDILENLIIDEGWNYKNIFPEGRKIKQLPTKMGAFINIFRSLYRLKKFIGKKKYDLFITDDVLVILGKLLKVKSFLFQDDDISAVPESRLLLMFTDYVIAPDVAQFGKYNNKKIGFKGFKASAYLHPNHFDPDKNVLDKYGLKNKRFFILRLVSLKATHDIGKKGIEDKLVLEIIKILKPYGQIIISSERPLDEKYEKYRLKIAPKDIVDLLYFSDLFIGDSQTMTMEAGYLGTPFIRYNDFIGQISYLNDIENNYKLGVGIKTSEKEKLLKSIKELVTSQNLSSEWKEKRNKMLGNTIDLNKFMIWLYTNFPQSVGEYKLDPNCQYRFK